MNLNVISMKLFLTLEILTIFSKILVKNYSYGKPSTKNSYKYISIIFIQYINNIFICVMN